MLTTICQGMIYRKIEEIWFITPKLRKRTYQCALSESYTVKGSRF